MRFHEELNQKIFDGEELKPEVKDKLKEIADAFIDFLEVPADAIKDVVITGSSVSYNYTKFSDIDLHLKVDFDKIHEDCPIVQGYLWQSKAMFNKNHDISIYGIPVEVYAESINEDTVHNGLYSLWQDKWIDFPKKIEPTDNDAAVEAKFNEFKDMADNINDSEEAEEIINKLYEMRKAGLEDAGEFSTENLAFKKIRDAGILDKLKAMKKARIDKQLSLESYNEGISVEDYIKNLGLDAEKKGVDYTLKGYKNGEVEYSVCYANLKKAAQCFLDNCGKYDKLVFSEIGQGYECVIDTDSKELNTMPKYLKDAFVNEEVEETKNYKRTRLCSPKSCKPDSFRTKTVNKDGDKIVLCKDKETGKMKAQSKLEKKNESVDKNIYKPALILKAYNMEKAWYKEAGAVEDEQLPEIMLFIIEDGEIKCTKKVKREDVYSYKGADNEYALWRTRDTGFVVDDYNLVQVDNLVASWNEGRKWSMDKEIKEDIATLTDKIDAADNDLKDLIDKLQPKKVDEDIDTLCDKVDSATSELQSIIKSFSAERNDIVESLESVINEALGE